MFDFSLLSYLCFNISFHSLHIFRPFHTCLNEWLFLLHIAHYVTFPTSLYSFRPHSMVCTNISFKLISLDVPGIRSFEKRKAVFNWLHKSRAEICFLQETYSTPEVVNIWKKQWKGDTFFCMAVVTVKVQ